jgi:hypothetical protein
MLAPSRVLGGSPSTLFRFERAICPALGWLDGALLFGLAIIHQKEDTQYAQQRISKDLALNYSDGRSFRDIRWHTDAPAPRASFPGRTGRRMTTTNPRRAVSARKRRLAKQQNERSLSSEQMVERELHAPTTAKLTVYLGAATVHIEVAKQ